METHSANYGLDAATQILDVLRRPVDWYEHVEETVSVVDDEMQRTVRITISDQRRATAAPDDCILALAVPRKGAIADLSLLDELQSHARLLSHDEHRNLATNLLSFRFFSIIRVLQTDYDAVLDPTAVSEQFADLVKLSQGGARSHTDPSPLTDYFENRWLTSIPRPADADENSVASELMSNLYELCQVLTDRYYKFVLIRNLNSINGVIAFTYTQESEARSYGRRPFRAVRRFFRAPNNYIFVHAPLARMTNHYEIHLTPILGSFVRDQGAYYGNRGKRYPSGRDRATQNSQDGQGPWSITRRPGSTSGLVFIGDGPLADRRIYAGFRLQEVPPGATGRAFAALLIGTLVVCTVVVWSLGRKTVDSAIAPSLLVALVSFGSAVLDNTMPNKDLINSPFLARFALFTQTIVGLIVALWLLVRGTIADAPPKAHGILSQAIRPTIMHALTLAASSWIGITAGLILLALLITLTVRTAVAAKIYDNLLRAIDNRHAKAHNVAK